MTAIPQADNRLRVLPQPAPGSPPALRPAPSSPATDQPARLHLRQVSKYFHTRRGRMNVLDRVNLQVQPGEFLCLLGPSGCGKTTLFNIIAGLEPPDSGDVLVDGHPITGPGPDRVVVFQEGALFPWLTALENVEFGLEMTGIARTERRRRARSALDMVHLTRFADSCIHELSGGMRQRIAIARGIAMKPQVLLMDEPFAALDAQTRNVMHVELQRIWADTGCTIVFVTHNVAEAVRLGDRVAVLSYRPGTIRREVPIHHPRPRQADDPGLLEIRTFLLRDLKADVATALQEELGDE